MSRVEKPSIVLTCFNLERYVGAAIQSVLDQAFDDAFELIVVDDCSTDRSAQIIQAFPQVRYLRTDRNSGVLLATVAGLKAATGDLIFFLDGDDLWEPTKLAMVCERFASDPKLALVTHDLIYIDEEGRALDRGSRPGQHLSNEPVSRQGALVRQGILLLSDFVWLGSAYAIRRGLAGIEEFCAWAEALPDARNTYQDWPLAYWIAAKDELNLAYIPSKLFRYRLHGRNHSGDASNPQNAVRNFRRTLNTSLAMLDIAVRANLSDDVKRTVRSQSVFYDYLVHLYSGRKMDASAGFWRSRAYLARNKKLVVKELARFAAIQILGPERFTRLKAAHRTG